MLFDDRRQAGRQLAWHLEFLRGHNVVVLGLARSGVPVAYEVAQELGAPLDVLVVRRLRVPWQPEWTFGAVGRNGVRVLDESVVRKTGLSPAEQTAVERRVRAELDWWVGHYSAGRQPLPLAGRTAVIVDDGLTTGVTAEAACRVVRGQGAAEIVFAVPVGSAAVVTELHRVADEVICMQTLLHMDSVGAWYHHFGQTSDAEVADLLARAAHPVPAVPLVAAAPSPRMWRRQVQLPAAGVRLAARLTLPDEAPAVVAFAHGSGSGRHGRHNRYLADALNRAGLGTLLLDLLTEDEEHDQAKVFDVLLLARRLRAAADWLRHETGLPIAHFGRGTGTAAALEAASAPDADVRALVSRGGRPDLVIPTALARVRAPTLLIVGGQDTTVLELNRLAADRMHCEHQLAVVPDATHLFTEPGALATVAELARDWFTTHLARPAAQASPRRSA
ncbi:phosphoribosyltransferase family protein [Streptomyces sp. S.PB5]|uniref:phosphoribosyltransferase family protein n=1 Tax=Streptomyces sp. S.PB5 TaxID=3020844 RepID=UPI0025AEF14D|nr:phosphoribosyltransferase family protein [Streptomyces sp. S.PB5]MDN3028439.1 phosphoribosyltransferase family protein [Streptomyces sp. S.PB5]